MAKTKAKKTTTVIDLESSVSEVSKHSKSSQHSSSDSQARRNKSTKPDHGEIMSLLATSPWFLNIPRGKRSKRMIRRQNAGRAASKQSRRLQSGAFEKRRISHRKTDHAASKQIKRLPTRISHKNADHEVLEENKRLDTGAFESYLENLWKSFSVDKRTSFTYLDCLWFTLYKRVSLKAKVLSWIEKKHIFSKKYVFVPIVCWRHWSLLILCHFGESLQSETRTTCMVLLDSLESADPRRLEPDIRKFVLDIYKAEGRPETKDYVYKIPLLVPKMIKSWFTREGLEGFCEKLESLK
ncbi:hypothetical protein FNV43_RR19574 [Rhamnella rubrinervis]|uniref:Ubiquitin-like protease family profile domain-containing protein n=1 Tax=Rhamnella rubrinervis TaxID=2594499 RepID=A0A8K0DUB4_9ROSA|nr:hypothetical protein FNV43_RR19574 [Rhamnella rubrinervis]